MDNQPQQPVNQPANNPQTQNTNYPQPSVVVGSNVQPNNNLPAQPIYQTNNPLTEPVPASAPKRKPKKILILICLVLVLAVIGGGAYALVGHETSYQTVAENFITAVQEKDQAKTVSLETPYYQKTLKTLSGNASFGQYCEQEIGSNCTNEFTNSFLNKAAKSYSNYTANGLNGKSINYLVKGNGLSANSCSYVGNTSMTINLLPNGNSWLVNTVSLNYSNGQHLSSSCTSAGTSTTTSTSSSQKAAATTAQPSDMSYFTISEWGVKAVYTGTPQLTYTISDLGGGATEADFTSAQLAASSSGCSASGAGVIEKSGANTVLDSGGTTPAKSAVNQSPYASRQIGGYYYTYIPPQGTCTNNTTLEQQTEDAVKALIANLQSV